MRSLARKTAKDSVVNAMFFHAKVQMVSVYAGIHLRMLILILQLKSCHLEVKIAINGVLTAQLE